MLAAVAVEARADLADPTARAAFLREEVRLARSRALYLVLDPGSDRLFLRRQHVDLLDIPVRARAGLPRWVGERQLTWPAYRFTLVSPLPMPPRPRVDQPRRAEGDTAAAPISVDDLQSARDRFLAQLPVDFRLEFAPELDVRVSGSGSSSPLNDRWQRGRRALREAWRNLGDRLAGRPPRLRLLLEMSPDDARRLYLALEPETALLVAPPPGDR